MDAQGAASELAFVEQEWPRLRGFEANAVLVELRERYADLMAALAWFVEHERPNEAMQLASRLTYLWMTTKRMDEGSTWFDRILALKGGDEARRGRALFDAGYLAFWQGDYERSSRLQNQALELGRRMGDPTITAIALTGLARIALESDVEEARRLCLEALAVTDGTDDRDGRSHATHVLGVASQMSGDLEAARRYMSERIALAREEGNIGTVAAEAGNLSMVERQLGNLDTAEGLAREALDIAARRGNELAIPWMMNSVAAVAAAKGAHERAATVLGAADGLLEAAGGEWPPDELVQHEQTTGVLTDAMGRTELERARAVGQSMTAAEAVALALADTG